ncbi:hypothetical protein PAMA_011305 [Pampus argenteus]
MDGRGVERNYRQNWGPQGDGLPFNNIQNNILYWLEVMENFGFHVPFGMEVNIADHHDDIGNNNDDGDYDDDDEPSTGMNPVQDVGANVEVNQHVREVDQLPGGSRKRSREEDEEEEDNKRFRWWYEFADSDSDCDDDVPSTGMNPVQDVGANVEVNQHVREVDQLPGGSRKRSREEDKEEEENKRFRWWDEFANSDSDCYDRMNPVQDVGANVEVNQHVREVDQLPGESRKRSREEDKDEDGSAGKKFRC